MNKKRHLVLGRRLHETLETSLEILARSETKYLERTRPGQPGQQFPRQSRIEKTVTYAVLEHLGYGPIPNLTDELRRGVDRSVEHFFGDWWAADEDDARALDRSRADRALRWYEVLPHALLLCGLTGRWDDAAHICSWFDDRIQLEQRFELGDDDDLVLYLCIVSHLRPEPMPGLGLKSTLDRLAQSKRKRTQLLVTLWNAVLAGDQPALNAALKESVQHFLKAHAEDVPNPNYWVALDESLMWLIAERKDLKFPTLPEKIDAAVIRRQTIGLAD